MLYPHYFSTLLQNKPSERSKKIMKVLNWMNTSAPALCWWC